MSKRTPAVPQPLPPGTLPPLPKGHRDPHNPNDPYYDSEAFRQRILRFLEADCARKGLPLTIENPDALREIGRLVGPKSVRSRRRPNPGDALRVPDEPETPAAGALQSNDAARRDGEMLGALVEALGAIRQELAELRELVVSGTRPTLAITIPQAAKSIGVSQSTVRRLVKAGTLPSVRPDDSRVSFVPWDAVRVEIARRGV
jgi:excisionase family DNA binding protein